VIETAATAAIAHSLELSPAILERLPHLADVVRRAAFEARV